MTPPSAKERARKLALAFVTPMQLGEDAFRALVTISESHFRAAESAARAEQLEADCRAVCRGCREGQELFRGVGDRAGTWLHREPFGKGGVIAMCFAQAIHDGGEKEST